MNVMTKALLLVPAGLLLAADLRAERVERTVDASPDGQVSISNTAGSIEVSGWSRNEVEVTGDLGADVDELIVERSGSEVIVKVRVPRHGSRAISTDLRIRVPEKSSIEVIGVSADIDVTDVQGGQRLQSVSGDVTTEVFAADLTAESVSGDVQVEGDNQPTHTQLSSVSGDVDVHGLAGEIEATSVSGSVSIVDGKYERVQANAVNGDVVFRSELLDGGRLDIETINGGVDVRFKGKISARFDIETFNGGIRNCFGPKPVRTSEYTPGRELKFTEGDGASRVRISTLNGGLNLCKE